MLKILLLMLFCHIVDDFFLQGIMANMKQRKWWKEGCMVSNMPFDKYKNDYMMALFEHSLEWSIAITLPVILFTDVNETLVLIIVIINSIIHYVVDDFKANKLRINLITDQIIHLLQVIVTWTIIVLYYG